MCRFVVVFVERSILLFDVRFVIPTDRIVYVLFVEMINVQCALSSASVDVVKT